MKKYILILCALCAGLVSCVKENFAGAEADGLVTFKASYETQTKTVLNGLTPYWTASEKIAIFNGVNNEFTATVTEPSATATFKGELAGKGTKNFRAVSPYSADYTYSSLGATFYGLSIPQEQAAVENSYDPQALVAIAQSDDYNLSFKNLGSLVKFTIISDGVTSVTLRANNEEVLSGSFDATYSANPGISLRAGKDEVTIKGDFKKGSTYYIVTLPASLEKGFVTLLNGSVKALSIDAPVQLARSGMVNLGELSLNPGESQLPDSGEEDGDEGVPSGWVIIGEFCGWGDEGTIATYDMGLYYKAFDVPAASLSACKFRNGDVWVGTAGEAVVADKWVAASKEGMDNNISFSGSDAAYDVYLDKELRAFYITVAGGAAPEAIPAPFVGKSVAGNFNAWNISANPMDAEGDYYVVKGLQLASTNLADPTSNGFKFVDAKGADQATWYGVGTSSVELGKWYSTKVDGSLNICINGDATALYDAYISKDMTTFCVVAAGAELPEFTPAPAPELPSVIYLKPGEWSSDAPRFEAYFFGAGETWVTMTDADKDGVFEAGVPAGMTSVIFVRMDSAKPEHSWDSKWNQTVDLTIPSGQNCFTFGSWGDESSEYKTTGTWSLYTPGSTPDPTPDPDPTPEPDPDPTPDPQPTQVRIYLSTAWGWPYIWCWDSNGAQIFAGASWPGTRYHGEENGYYYWDVPAEYVGKTVSLLAVKGDQSEKTSDFNNVVLDKSVYFYLEWTQELGCHLIQENK